MSRGSLDRCGHADEGRTDLPKAGRGVVVVGRLVGGLGFAVGEVGTRDALYLRRRREVDRSLGAIFSEDLQRYLIAVERSCRSGVRLKMDEQLDDLVLSNTVVEGDP